MVESDKHVVVAHQPNFLPWMGFFYKMTYSDTFVLLDDVQYTKGGYTNRVMIKQNDQTIWLTVPVTMPQSKTPINRMVIHPESFVRKHLRSLQQSYGKCSFFDEVFGLLEPIYQHVNESLADFNITLLMALAGYLDMPCRFVRKSTLGIDGKNNAMLAEIASAVGGTLYVSGLGAQSYMAGHEQVYLDRGVRIGYQVFSPPSYPQRGKEFLTGCSIVDLLFNHGCRAREFLRPQAEPPYTEM